MTLLNEEVVVPRENPESCCKVPNFTSNGTGLQVKVTNRIKVTQLLVADYSVTAF